MLSGCVFLCYHRIGQLTSDYWQNVVSPDNFREHLKVIKRYYQPASMSQLINSFELGAFPGRRTIIVTFDDGYASNLTYACEPLSEFDLPAIFFLNTYLLEENKNYWWDELQYLLNEATPPISVNLSVFSHETNLPFKTPNQKAYSFFFLHRLFKSLDLYTRERILSSLKEQIKVIGSAALVEERKPLTSSEIENLSRDSLFEIGGHTHSHRALSLLSDEEQQDEIQKNKKILEKITNKDIIHFSYPFGGKGDFDDISIKILRKLGFRSASTTLLQPFRVGGDILRIPRISVKNWDATKFKTKLNQLWAK